jgi:hypothetical protein
MRCLTTKQPLAGCIAHLDKRVENRTWRCPPQYLGTPIAIHAAAAVDKMLALGVPCSGEDWASLFATTAEWDAWRFWHHGRRQRDEANWPPKLALGAVVATAVIVGCHHQSDDACEGDPRTAGYLCSIWPWLGQFHWVLDDVRLLAEQVPCRGAQRLWRLPEDVKAAVLAQAGRQPMASREHVENVVAKPGDPDLDCDLFGRRRSSVVEADVGDYDIEVALGFDTSEAAGWWLDSPTRVWVFPSRVTQLTVSFAVTMQPGYEHLAPEMLSRLRAWRDDGA